MMKYRIRGILFITAFIATTLIGAKPALATDYSDSRLLDDVILDNTGAMSQGQIRDFLSGADGRLSGGSTCLKNYVEHNFHFNSGDGHWYYGDNTRSTGDFSSPSSSLTAATWNTAWGPANIPAYKIIYQAAQQWGINPQVLLATLQKEETLISGTTCNSARYWSAMGYDCPDSGGTYYYSDLGIRGTCVKDKAYAGFARQILWGSWQLKFNKERSEGNTAWDGDGSIVYPGYMTKGSWARCDSCTVRSFDGYATIDGHSVFMSNGATASLYSYTPHLGQSFPFWFEKWFGSTIVADPDAVGVYRLYQPSVGEHFFTAYLSEKNSAITKAGYTYEGVGFRAYKSQLHSSSPIYRLYKNSNHRHFYTASHIERDALVKNGFTYEEVAFYGFTSNASSGRPVYRLLNRSNGLHMFTISLNERNKLISAGYKDEGIGWYAPY